MHPHHRSARRAAVGLVALAALSTACADDASDGADAPPTTERSVEHRLVEANGTTLAVDLRGAGAPTLLVHGAGEDAAQLAPLATELARSGRQVITYDRRGTGGSGREDWPAADGAAQHADDAAALLEALDVGPAEVVGLSSGGVIALDLATRHPEVVDRTFLWEAPALGLIPGGAELNAQLMQPVTEHLAAHPDDLAGAQALLLEVILGAPVDLDDAAFDAVRANAEPMLRDDPGIVVHSFAPDDVAGLELTIAVGQAPNPAVEGAVAVLAEVTGTAPTTVATPDHDAHLHEPAVLARAIEAGR